MSSDKRVERVVVCGGVGDRVGVVVTVQLREQGREGCDEGVVDGG